MAAEIGDTNTLRDTQVFQLAIASMVGDRAEADRRLTALQRLADQSRRRDSRVFSLWREAQQTVFAGHLADGERLTIEGMTLAGDAGIEPENVSATIGALFYAIRQGQGRVEELIPALEDLVTAQPGLPVWRLALAGAFYECDRFEEARPHYDWLVADKSAVAAP